MVKKICLRFMLLLFICASVKNSRAQQTFESRLEVWKGDVKQAILAYAKMDSRLQQMLSNARKIVIIPRVKLRPTYEELLTHSLNILQIDTPTTFRISKINDTVYAVQKIRLGYYQPFIELMTPDDLDIIEFCLKQPGKIFKINILDEGVTGFIPFAILNEGKVRLVDGDSTIYDGIDDYINKLYGSIEKYAELVEREKERKNALAKMITLEDCKNVYRKSYFEWSQLYPADTMRIIDLFINELDSLVHLKPGQLTLLKYKISYRIRHPYHNCGLIEVLNCDVTDELKIILTTDQFFNYNKKLYITNWRASMALRRIEEYYFTMMKFP